jgi:tRNA(Glu) U13 pseudouridine synthase TruD
LYKELLTNDGIQLDKKSSQPEGTAKGSYRCLIQKAHKIKWDIVGSGEETTMDESDDPVVSAARFKFDLKSGCYATMMLRELMVTTMARDNKIKV